MYQARFIVFFCFCLSMTVFAESGHDYLDKFIKYNQWNQHLPISPTPEFLAFVDNTTPLSKKLREKWLYELARTKDWATYSRHYQNSPDTNLQCYQQIALYQQGHRQQAIESAQKLWLNGSSLPKACDGLFTQLLKNNELGESLITKRLALALEKHNIPLAIYLLKQYKPARIEEIPILMAIHQNPKHIIQLTPSKLHHAFYLYGLKRMVSISIDQAIPLWQLAKTQQFLSHAEHQAFLAHLALYKAMRNHPDTPHWFAKVEPAFYNDILLGWQIRFALKYRQWPQVEQLINQVEDKNNPCWQYWLARSLNAQGEKEKAMDIYRTLAATRNYYGFLASLRLKRNFSFNNERPVENNQILQPYQPFTEQIKALYRSKQTLQASRLLNDFASELPKNDKSALAYWLSRELQWHEKSVYLSNNNELNNQLSLRFPLAYQDTIITNAKNYQIPQELIYAIIRQESAFRDDAVSAAGAQGLMQVMPSTALAVSKNKKMAYVDKKQLFSSQKNISIGVAYLQLLAKRFDKHPILMVAAYNAGPKQVSYWLKNHPPKDIDIWIETLPWHETRNYLKNVIAFYAVYQYRMQEKPDLTPFMKEFYPVKN